MISIKILQSIKAKNTNIYLVRVTVLLYFTHKIQLFYQLKTIKKMLFLSTLFETPTTKVASPPPYGVQVGFLSD
jgi:hypothetical protein